MKIVCIFCNVFAYNTDEGDDTAGLAPGTSIQKISKDWRCPVCGKPKTFLKPVDETVYSMRMKSYLDFLEKRRKKMPSLKSLLEHSRVKSKD
jgi:rubredoxin